MRITRPLNDQPNLLVAEEVLPPSEAQLLKDFYLYKHTRNPVSNEWPYDTAKPEKISDEIDDAKEQECIPILRKLDQIAKDTWAKEFPDIKLGNHWLDYGNPNVMQSGDRMEIHDDGPPNSILDHGVRSAAFVYYISADIEGGELTYPELGYDYKPADNTAVLHINQNGFSHGVKDVISGWRISYGFFGFEDYDDSILIGINTERPQGT
jgi:hypothetical protein